MKAGSLAKAAAGVLLVAAGASASAQELFGSLLATDRPEVAHQKLKALGYSGFGLTERAGCKVDDQCLGTFTGPSVSKGFVRFSAAGIRSVRLETSHTADIVAALSRKHGPPSVPRAVSGGPVTAAVQNQQLPTQVWNLPTGVQITVGKDGSVSYSSPEVLSKPSAGTGVKNF